MKSFYTLSIVLVSVLTEKGTKSCRNFSGVEIPIKSSKFRFFSTRHSFDNCPYNLGFASVYTVFVAETTTHGNVTRSLRRTQDYKTTF